MMKKEEHVRDLLDGAAAIARGALDEGCNFFAGYPITPASGILAHMLRELPKVGGTGIQGEDEIASIGYCIGAATAGAKVFTATSGPGLSLYSENLGVAIMMEIPLVIVIAQRLGPSTGAATASAQGDIQFMRWGTSGGYPMIVLSPTTISGMLPFNPSGFSVGPALPGTRFPGDGQGNGHDHRNRPRPGTSGVP